MDKKFYDICYEALSHYLNVPDVADTYKSIGDGIDHWKNYPQNDIAFQCKRVDIINYILKVRVDNFIYQCQEGNKLFEPAIPGFPNKTLYDVNRVELRIQLENEIAVLLLKGIHQAIKHRYPMLDDTMLSTELLQQGAETIQKFGIAEGGQRQWIN